MPLWKQSPESCQCLDSLALFKACCVIQDADEEMTEALKLSTWTLRCSINVLYPTSWRPARSTIDLPTSGSLSGGAKPILGNGSCSRWLGRTVVPHRRHSGTNPLVIDVVSMHPPLPCTFYPFLSSSTACSHSQLTVSRGTVLQAPNLDLRKWIKIPWISSTANPQAISGLRPHTYLHSPLIPPGNIPRKAIPSVTTPYYDSNCGGHLCSRITAAGS